MIRFDLNNTQIPSNASKIAKAELSLYLFEAVGFPENVEGVVCSLYTVTKEWDELSVTWIDAKTDDPWNQKGGDFSAEKPVVVNYAPKDSWEVFDVTSAAKNFIENPTSNFGFHFISGECNKGRYYYTSNYTDQELRPKLTFEVEE